MTPDRYRPVDTDEVLRRVDTHARVGAALLGGLGEVGHEEEDAAFTSELVTAARNAAEHELADVAHELLRRCLHAHSAYTSDLVWITAPLSTESAHDAIITLYQRVFSRTPEFDLPTPGAATDVRPLQAALEICRALEGDSERVLFCEAEIPAIHEQWHEVAQRTARLADTASSPQWRLCALVLQSRALICLKRGADAGALIRSAIDEFGPTRPLVANLACAHALQADNAGFDAAARALSDSGEPNDSFEWPEWVRSNAAWFAELLDRREHQILEAFGLERIQ